MRKRKTSTLPPKVSSDPIWYRVQEGGFILLSALSVFLIVALITYHDIDPGWSFTSTEQSVQNAAGQAGAWFSDLFFYFFGYIAYLFPLLLGIAGIRLFQNRFERAPVNRLLWGFRCVGLLLAVSSGCALATLYFAIWDKGLPVGAGGICGQLVSAGLTANLGQLGATVLLVASFLAGITLTTGLSWFGLMDVLARSTFIQLQKFQTLGVEWILRLKERRIVKSTPKRVSPILSGQNKPMIRPPVARPPVKAAKPVMRILPAAGESELPSVLLLEDAELKDQPQGYSTSKLEELSRDLEARLAEFGVRATVVSVYPGPVITRFELDLAAGVKVSKISGLSKDLARALSVNRVRVVEVIPGKSVIGLEIPNENREMVLLREILESKQYQESASHLSLALGKDIAGAPTVVNLAKMPHLLVAGTTGSGKSVGINVMLLSLLYKATPQDVRLILIDPKMLELSVYDGIPHLLTPVVTDMKDAASALRWCVGEMERRYHLMSGLGVRNLAGYNRKIAEAGSKNPILNPLVKPESGEEPEYLERLPYIVVIIDEFADMIMVVGKKVEELIARIAQKARAAGIHLILATQRPSVDVITGLIKANVPTRIAFQVSSRIDSRTILDQQGAEQLLGHGDMLYLAPGTGVPERIHGAFVSDEEVHTVVKALKQLGEPDYVDDIISSGALSGFSGSLGFDDNDGEQDDLYDQAVQIVSESKRASISHLQRRLKIGYNRAARLIETMEAAGIVSSMQSNGAREVLVNNSFND